MLVCAEEFSLLRRADGRGAYTCALHGFLRGVTFFKDLDAAVFI